jgi:hypothetical protein
MEPLEKSRRCSEHWPAMYRGLPDTLVTPLRSSPNVPPRSRNGMSTRPFAPMPEQLRPSRSPRPEARRCTHDLVLCRTRKFSRRTLGFPRTPETVEHFARLAGADLRGANVEIIESPDDIAYLDFQGASPAPTISGYNSGRLRSRTKRR